MTIHRLEDLVSDALNIPFIAEDDAVFDGCFNTEPWMTETLTANGVPVHITDHISINLFHANKVDAISSVHELLPILAENKVVASMPDYSWQDNAKLWMTTINVQC